MTLLLEGIRTASNFTNCVQIKNNILFLAKLNIHSLKQIHVSVCHVFLRHQPSLNLTRHYKTRYEGPLLKG